MNTWSLECHQWATEDIDCFILYTYVENYACRSSNSHLFRQQVAAFSTMLSFKGSPYWMAPEVVTLFYLLFTFLLQVVQWKALMLLQLIGFHIMLPFFRRLWWAKMVTLMQSISGVWVVLFSKWQHQSHLGASLKGYIWYWRLDIIFCSLFFFF